MGGRPITVIGFTVANGKIAEIDAVATPTAPPRSRQLPSTTSSRRLEGFCAVAGGG
jgi:hypothetical protein